MRTTGTSPALSSLFPIYSARPHHTVDVCVRERDADFFCSRVLNPENSLVWHQQVLGWINKYSGIGESNPEAISLGDTDIPVVDYDPVA
jgi:hypothetical protein